MSASERPDLPVAAPDPAREVASAIEAARLQLAMFAPHGFDSGRVSEYHFASELRGCLDQIEAALRALLAERQQDKEHIERADAELKSIIIRCEEGDPKADWLPTIARLAHAARAALAVEEDAQPGKPETPGNSGAAVEEDAANG